MTNTHDPVARLSAVCLGLGGILGAAFVIVSRGEIVGAMAGQFAFILALLGTAAGAALGLIPPRPFGKAPWILMDAAWVILAIGLVGISRVGSPEPISTSS